MDSFIKQANEQFKIEIDFSSSLDDGETIASYTVAAVNYKTNSVVTSTVIESSTNDTSSVYITVKNGTDYNSFKITTIITTTSSNIYEKDVLMRVRDE